MSPDLILYDGLCALCNRFVRFVLRRDRGKRFQFASLQSPAARDALARHREDSATIEAVCLLSDLGMPVERLFVRSDALVAVLRELGGVWRPAAAALGVVPRVLRDPAYDLVARVRRRIFGSYETCPLPEERFRDRFVGL